VAAPAGEFMQLVANCLVRRDEQHQARDLFRLCDTLDRQCLTAAAASAAVSGPAVIGVWVPPG
jgi:hypothetical protein